MAAKALKITLINNIPYRPDLMGIENYWRLAKKEYRAILTNKRARELELENLKMVKQSFSTISNMRAKKAARNGIKALMSAKPVAQTNQDDAADQTNKPKVSQAFKDNCLK